mmetsp:Transcript_15224/g.45948  ORF Transcript_15224/g.45948 Transcript_15224/m.45948 type:complete len:312 (-) Transcript_15224:328-1263(-)|eukprot:CAMPEP_0206143892 /NCGR_PEP_ID=MMETSP1473-20131121/22222_1 /ASSEMBLY_ACC=CAM_ASM_001109 /TAXON_ID=1461547 /ORGANISM="Stichococcus sp, Strain RCC1054" /LENGTH=311 /DNA_ID=CAMNT_0053539505 /DNA_START=70 /DNA_END=1005 /DNA_ORIENTATION=+
MQTALSKTVLTLPPSGHCGRGLRRPGAAERQPGRAHALQRSVDGDNIDADAIDALLKNSDPMDAFTPEQRIFGATEEGKQMFKRLDEKNKRVFEEQIVALKAESERISEKAAKAKEAELNAAYEVAEKKATAMIKSAERERQQAQGNSALARQAFESQIKDKERIQSGLAAAVAVAGGWAVQLPLQLPLLGPWLAADRWLLGNGQAPPLPVVANLAAVTVSSALFGVIWRYVVREEDALDLHLRGGCIAAFGLTSGLWQSAALINSATEISADTLAQAALVSGQAMLQFAAAAAVVEYAIDKGWLLRKSSS